MSTAAATVSNATIVHQGTSAISAVAAAAAVQGFTQSLEAAAAAAQVAVQHPIVQQPGTAQLVTEALSEAARLGVATEAASPEENINQKSIDQNFSLQYLEVDEDKSIVADCGQQQVIMTEYSDSYDSSTTATFDAYLAQNDATAAESAWPSCDVAALTTKVRKEPKFERTHMTPAACVLDLAQI